MGGHTEVVKSLLLYAAEPSTKVRVRSRVVRQLTGNKD